MRLFIFLLTLTFLTINPTYASNEEEAPIKVYPSNYEEWGESDLEEEYEKIEVLDDQLAELVDVADIEAQKSKLAYRSCYGKTGNFLTNLGTVGGYVLPAGIFLVNLLSIDTTTKTVIIAVLSGAGVAILQPINHIGKYYSDQSRKIQAEYEREKNERNKRKKLIGDILIKKRKEQSITPVNVLANDIIADHDERVGIDELKLVSSSRPQIHTNHDSLKRKSARKKINKERSDQTESTSHIDSKSLLQHNIRKEEGDKPHHLIIVSQDEMESKKTKRSDRNESKETK